MVTGGRTLQKWLLKKRHFHVREGRGGVETWGREGGGTEAGGWKEDMGGRAFECRT